MKRASTWLAWIVTVAVAALAALNWEVLGTLAPINLGVAVVQLPLGLTLLGVAAVLAALFFLASMQQTIASLLETRRLLREMQRVQELADKAELSRLESLQQAMADDFRRVHQRLDALRAPPARIGYGSSDDAGAISIL
ncbi:MAG: LapA family protein [Rubrivivax sp.]